MAKHEALDRLIARHPELGAAAGSIGDAMDLVIRCYRGGGKLLVAGNGGSSADSAHIVGELLKGFNKKRPLPEELKRAIRAASGGMDTGGMEDRLQSGLPAVSLAAQTSILTAVANDLGADLIFAQQVIALGRSGDVLIGMSTSGNADNVCKAAVAARALGMSVVTMTGGNGGKLAELADVDLRAPAAVTSEVQEFHLLIYHALCDAVESAFFDR